MPHPGASRGHLFGRRERPYLFLGGHHRGRRDMAGETLAFKTELKQLLHLIIHSLYSHPDIFLRELISNASDALDTVRFQSLTRAELLEDNADWQIRLIPDAAAGTLTVSDNGIGMSRETIVEN